MSIFERIAMLRGERGLSQNALERSRIAKKHDLQVGQVRPISRQAEDGRGLLRRDGGLSADRGRKRATSGRSASGSV